MNAITPRKQVLSEITPIAAGYGLEAADLFRKTKSKTISHPRQHAMAYLRERGWPYGKIGRFFGLDHKTCMFGVRRHHERVAQP